MPHTTGILIPMVSEARLSRAERKERTRLDLTAAARRVFLRHGFHGASLDEIADEAGYTKGAVYSNFAGKDDLFLGVLERQFEERLEAYRQLTAGLGLEETYRAVARLFMEETAVAEPGWTPLVSEFMTHASRREPLRRELVQRRDGFQEGIAAIIEDLGRRNGVEWALPPKEVARGSGALFRGLAVERLLDPEGVPIELVEEIHVAYMRGMERPAGRGGSEDGGNDDSGWASA
jgi:AcrR family transcriptional regulator